MKLKYDFINLWYDLINMQRQMIRLQEVQSVDGSLQVAKYTLYDIPPPPPKKTKQINKQTNKNSEEVPMVRSDLCKLKRVFMKTQIR